MSLERNTYKDRVDVISYSLVFEVVDLHLNGTKVSSNIKTTVQNISCAVEPLDEEEGHQEIAALFNSSSVSDQISLAVMSAKWQKHPVLGLVHQYVATGNKFKSSEIAKVKSNVACKFEQLGF